MADEKTRATDIKVGVFVTLGVVALVIVVFLIGQERHFFERPVFLKAHFSNVAGLKVGAPVRLAGVDVGIVSRIDFPPLVTEADDLLVSTVDLGAARYRETPPDTALSTLEPPEGEPASKYPARLRGWPLSLRDLQPGLGPVADPSDVDGAVSGVPYFITPTRLAVTARALAPGGQGDGRLTVEVFVRGGDQWGRALQESIKVSITRGTELRVLSTKAYTSVHNVVVTYVGEAEPGETVTLGIDPLREITVTIRVRAESLERIRRGSVAKVDSMGLLGDKTIDISMGPATALKHEDGQTVLAQPVGDLFAGLEQGLGEVKGAFEGVRKVLDQFLKGGGDEKINELLEIVNALGDEIQHGEGLIHQLIYDSTAENKYKIKEVVAQVNLATQKVNKTLADIDGMVAEVKTGDGVIHEAVYGKGGEEAIAAAKQTLLEAKQILQDVREKEGIVHQLIYKEDNGATITNVTQVTEDLKVAAGDIKTASADAKDIVAEVKRGEGTLGAIIKDPTVYEDVKTLLGNAKRNDAVKALVRYAIEREDQIATPKGGTKADSPAPR